jgi:hypothetical protein
MKYQVGVITYTHDDETVVEFSNCHSSSQERRPE